MGKRDASMSWLNHFCDWIVLLWSYRVSCLTAEEAAWNLSTDLSLTLLFLTSHQLRHIHYRLVRLCLYSSLSSHLFFSMISLLSPLFTIHFGTQFSFVSKPELVSFGLNWRSPWLNWGLELHFSVVRSFLNRNFVHSVSILLKPITSETSNWHQIYKNTPLSMILYSFMLWIMRNE